MYKRLIKTVCLIFLISIIITGCSNSLKSENMILKNEAVAANEKNFRLNKEAIEIKEKNEKLENSVNDLNKKLKELEKSQVKELPFEKKSNIYAIYTANIDTYKKEVGVYIYIPKETDLNKKLSTLANVLSEVYFNNLPIEILNIEEVDKKKIVTVNLKEAKENQGITDRNKFIGNTWATKSLQGSAGGIMTSTALIETILQRETSDEWIDGVKFLYNNDVCDFQHAPELLNINYRR